VKRVLAIAVGGLLLAAAGVAQFDWSQVEGPRYIQRLHLPIRGEAFKLPRAVHADLHTGEVFVCDTFNNRIVIFDERGLFRFQIVGGETFRAPADIAVDPEGYLFVLALHAGHKALVLLDFDGLFIQEIELSGLPPNFLAPELLSIALSPSGERLFVVDKANNRLWIGSRDGQIETSVDLAPGFSEKEAEELRLGHVDVYGETVLVAMPTTGRIEMYDLDGISRGGIGMKGTAPCQTGFPVAAALAADGKVLVVDKQRALFMIWNPEGNRCLSEHSGFGNVPGAFYQPGDLALDGQGRAYVSQGFEGRVQVFEEAPPAARPSEADSRP
jgi:DNA-binding beta-propeller fold protein YncE